MKKGRRLSDEIFEGFLEVLGGARLGGRASHDRIKGAATRLFRLRDLNREERWLLMDFLFVIDAAESQGEEVPEEVDLAVTRFFCTLEDTISKLDALISQSSEGDVRKIRQFRRKVVLGRPLKCCSASATSQRCGLAA